MSRRLFVSAILLFFLNGCVQPPQNGREITAQAQQGRQAAVQEAQKCAQKGDRVRLLSVLSEANAKYPDDPTILRMLGYALIYNNHADDAIATFDRLLAINPKYAPYYADKAMALDFIHQHAAAQNFYRRALALAPNDTAIENNLAMSMILNGQFDEAIGILKPLSKQAGASKKVRQNLALAYGLSGDVKKARAVDLQDLTPEMARENELFYEQYAKSRPGGPVVLEGAGGENGGQ